MGNIVKKIVSYRNTFVLLTDDSVWGCGENTYGELGIEDTEVHLGFRKCQIAGVSSIALGEHHTMFLRNNGQLYIAGLNEHGQLGHGDNVNSDSPLLVSGITQGILKIAAGKNFCAALTSTGNVFTWGENNHGQLGLGDVTNKNYPTQVLISDVKDIACGEDQLFILKNDATMYVCGKNSDGQLGVGDTTDRISPVRVPMNEIYSVFANKDSTFFINIYGEVYATGNNTYGQLGLGDTTNRTSFSKVPITNAEMIYPGPSHTVIKDGNNKFYVCGCNNHGQLGLGDLENRESLVYNNSIDILVDYVYCGGQYTAYIDDNEEVWVCGNNMILGLPSNHTNVYKNNIRVFTKVPNMTKVEAIVRGFYSIMFLRSTDVIYSSGSNKQARLGLPIRDVFPITKADDSYLPYVEPLDPVEEIYVCHDINHVIKLKYERGESSNIIVMSSTIDGKKCLTDIERILTMTEASNYEYVLSRAGQSILEDCREYIEAHTVFHKDAVYKTIHYREPIYETVHRKEPIYG